jgi:predicted extracellular nuclease
LICGANPDKSFALSYRQFFTLPVFLYIRAAIFKFFCFRKEFMRSNITLAPTRRTRLYFIVFTTAVAATALGYQLHFMRTADAATSVFINEIHYDNTGTDAGEAIEIAGPAGTDLTGWSIVLYNGSGGAVYDTDALSGTIPNQENGFGTISVSYPVNGIQNGAPDGIALVNASSVVVQFLSYEGSFTAVGGPANGLMSTDVGVSENGSEPIGQSLRLSGTGQSYEDFTWQSAGSASFGAVNPGQSFGSGVSLSISDVTITEGDSGTVVASFNVSTSSGAHSGVGFDIATQDNSATTADGDYVSNSLTAQLIPGGQQNYQFTVTVNGDTSFEGTESFFVNITNVTGATLLDGQGVGTITNDDCPAPAADIVISQVYGGGGNTGAQFQSDFIELYNQGATTVSLSGWSVQYTSATGSGTWQVTPLNGSIAPGGYYLVQEATGNSCSGSPCGVPLPLPDAIGTIAMAGGAGKVVLSSSTTPYSGTCPTCFVDMVGYGGASCFEGAGPTAATSNTTAALRKRGGCFDSDNNNVDFSISSPNPRNSGSATRTCTFTPAAIHDIQGNGLVSPFLGEDVTTTGIVTAKKSNGFFLQTTAVDSDDATSEGIFVFTSSAPAVTVGDGAMVQGTATEFFNLTQIESSLPGDVMVTSSGNALPAAVTLTTTILDPAGSFTQLERFEGMLMHADTLVSVAPSNEFGETFTVLEGVARPLREPGIESSQPVPPDPTSGLPDCCIPIWDLNPERIMIDSDGLAGASPISVTSNVTFSNVTGPLDFTFGGYKVLPISPPTTSANMSAVPVPTPVANEFTVAGYNIENFTDGATQRIKAALAIRTVMNSPDIIGHIEILNLATLQALADEVNNQTVAAGGTDPMYQAFLIPAPAGGTQNVGFLVKTSRVQVDAVTQERATDTYINPITNMPENLHDRPPLVLKATVNPGAINEIPVIAVVNHPRSFIDVELVGGDGPRVRAKRKAQAESIAGLLQELQTDNPNTPVIAVGDYNAYQFNDGYTDPIATIKGTPTADDEMVVDASPDVVDPNFINLTDQLPADQRYSFIFEGTPQALDHVIVNNVAHSLVTRYAIARNNADFPEVPSDAFAGDQSRPERNSDHDMPVAYFLAKATTTTSVSDVTATYSGANQPVTLTANVSAANGTVNEGTITFTVTNASDAVIGAPVVATVSGGMATASYTLPGGTLPQALTITADFSGGDFTYPSTDTGILNVTYGICLDYDPTKAVKSGATYPIKILLCDLNGNNVSAEAVVVTAVGAGLISSSEVGEVMASGNSNPDNNFRFAGGRYIYNLKTTGLTMGTYNLYFTAGTDPLQHAVQFRVK